VTVGFRPSKYRAKRTGKYASKREADTAAKLKLLEQAGGIVDLREQVPFDLLPACPTAGYSRPLRYIADFVFIEEGKRVVADSKGFRTPVYLLKKRLMAQLHGIAIREI
jgi:uncharacterized protein DUF1064